MIRWAPSLKPGDPAPAFSLPDKDGKLHSLPEFKGRWLVLFFYPKDFTSGCTAESCLFRELYAKFRQAGAEIMGISADSESSHAAFAAQYQLPYLLLSDRSRAAHQAYTVPHILGRMSGRSSFVIDPEGLIRFVFDSRSQHDAHVEKTLEFLRSKP